MVLSAKGVSNFPSPYLYQTCVCLWVGACVQPGLELYLVFWLQFHLGPQTTLGSGKRRAKEWQGWF
jgi:hypothetical protein